MGVPFFVYIVKENADKIICNARLLSVPITALILKCALIDNSEFMSIVNGLTKTLEGRQNRSGGFLMSVPILLVPLLDVYHNQHFQG